MMMMKKGFSLLAAAVLVFALAGTAFSEEDSLLDQMMAEIEVVAKLMQTGPSEDGAGTVCVLNAGEVEARPGDLVVLTALVDAPTADFTIRWEMLDLTEYPKSDAPTPWLTVGTGEMYRFIAEENLVNQCFRAALCFPDGREVLSAAVSVALSAKDDGQDAPADDVPVPEIPVIPDADALSSLDETPAPTDSLPDPDGELRSLRAVSIEADYPAVLHPGDTITLRGVTEGFVGERLVFQWECDRGSGFEKVESGQDGTCSFTVTAESLTWKWRLTVREA